MPRLATSLLLAALLAGTFASASPSARRMLLDDGVNGDGGEASPSAWVERSNPARVATDLAPVFLALQGDAALLDGVLACSEVTGIASIASDLPQLLLQTVQNFRLYGYCAKATQAEQVDMLSGMLGQAISIHMRDMLLDEYSCKGMTGLPEECEFASLVDAPLQAAVEAKGGALLCTEIATDGAADRVQVPVLELPAGWAPAAEPAYSCQERD